MLHRARRTLPLPQPFDFALLVESHGWFALPPFRWQREQLTLTTAWSVARSPVTVEIKPRDDKALLVAISSSRPIDRQRADQVVATTRRFLSLDADLGELHTLAARDPEFRWIARRGAGRLLRGPSVFEDMVKVLLTTNCSWSLTTTMVRRLIAELGEAAPGGFRTFPSPEAMAEHDERFYRERVRVGYRARALVELARAVVHQRIAPERWRDPDFPAAEIEGDIASLLGFGPYAIGGLLRLLGQYQHLALDSWCRSRFAKLYHEGRKVSDRTIARRYAPFGRLCGLALWLDLTREWHEGGGAPTAVRRTGGGQNGGEPV